MRRTRLPGSSAKPERPNFREADRNAYDRDKLLRNDLTAAQVQVGVMEGRRDFAGDAVTQSERANLATEQALRTGGNHGQRDASKMLGLPLEGDEANSGAGDE